jgi:hypothetical protein
MTLQGSFPATSKVCRQLHLRILIWAQTTTRVIIHGGQVVQDQVYVVFKEILVGRNAARCVQLQEKCVSIYIEEHGLMIASQNVLLLYNVRKKILSRKIEPKIKLSP